MGAVAMAERQRNRGCLSEGQLRFLLDAGPESGAERLHLAGCRRCSERLELVRRDAAITTAALARLDAADAPDAPDLIAAYGRLRARLVGDRWMEPDSRDSLMSDLWSRRWVRAAGAIAAMLVMMLAFTASPVRTVANDFLNQFRVQKFVAVTIPMDMLQPLQTGMLENMSESEKADIQQQLERLGSFETTFDLEQLPAPVTLAEAEQQYGPFNVPTDLPADYASAPEAYVVDDGGASLTLNVDEVQALIERMNLPIFAFRDVTAETLTFEVSTDPAVVLQYTAPSGQQLVVVQTKSPRLITPDDFDMNDFREDILGLPFIPPDVVAQLRAVDDWESTLIIPVPEGATSEDLDDVNGEPGLLIEYQDGAAVLWQKDGILYAVFGQAPADDVRDAAASMEQWQPAAD
jgi:anti-sigma factor RsiW